jgi:hypothetical protein
MLYNSTNDSGWIYYTNWKETSTPSNWYGVTVEAGHVTALRLSENHLDGSIPVELVNLSSLQILDFNFNWLKGAIPPELGNLNSLVSLSMSINMLGGTIPPGWVT